MPPGTRRRSCSAASDTESVKVAPAVGHGRAVELDHGAGGRVPGEPQGAGAARRDELGTQGGLLDDPRQGRRHGSGI